MFQKVILVAMDVDARSYIYAISKSHASESKEDTHQRTSL
jgi:hypothetical protein